MYGEQPAFRALGFGDISYVSRDGQDDDGFVIGQAVAHVVAGLGDRLNLFSEISATATDSEYKLDIERLFVKYDFSDELKLSAGRYHTPIGYWNYAYHHGAWLQTSVGRPEMVKFGSQVVPIHFVGLLLEGEVPKWKSGFGYRVGLGNGRHGNISRAGDAGDINGDNAWLASAYFKPDKLRGLNAGITFYSDTVTPDAGVEISEDLYSAYVAFEREDPEIIIEYLHAEHDAVTGTTGSGSTDGFYVHAAYRLGGKWQNFKPYARAEQVDVENADPLLSGRGLDYDGIIAGLRYELTPFAALKFEYRNEEFANAGRENNFQVQLSFAIVGHRDVGGSASGRGVSY